MSRLFRDVDGGPLCPNGSVVCIGAFDGLHLGHRALVRHAVARARTIGVESVALSFEPLPREFFARDNPPPRLSLPRAKIEGLRELGIDVAGLLRFDGTLAAMSAEAFVEQVLVKRLGANEVWVGPEFRFGHRRAGGIHALLREGARHGFSAGEIEPLLLDGERVSSTRIRRALVDGDFALAARLLGKPYAISGRVVRGQQLGRTPSGECRSCSTLPAIRRRSRLCASEKRASTDAGCEVQNVSAVVTPWRISSSQKNVATSVACARSANCASCGNV